MSNCLKKKEEKVVFNEETINYIIKEIQKKQNYQTTLQEDEYNLQMENYIKDIENIQKQYPKIYIVKIVEEYIEKNI